MSGPSFASETDARPWAETLLAAERHTLEMIASGAGLSAVLEALCSSIDAQSPGLASAVLLMDPDGKRLWPTAGRAGGRHGLDHDTAVIAAPRNWGQVVSRCRHLRRARRRVNRRIVVRSDRRLWPS